MIQVATLDKHKCLVGLCGLAGLRVSEARSIRPSNIDLSRRVLTVRGKGDKTRQVPISDELWDILFHRVMDVFGEGQDGPLVDMKDRFSRALITDLGVRAGLRRAVASHDLRATFATEVYNKTLDLRLVQDLLGHSSADQSSLYTGRSDDQLREGVNL